MKEGRKEEVTYSGRPSPFPVLVTLLVRLLPTTDLSLAILRPLSVRRQGRGCGQPIIKTILSSNVFV